MSQRVGDRVPVTVSVSDDGLDVTGSRARLARVLGNLLDNAQRHAVRSVSVTVARDAGEVLVAVTDDGAGVPDAERERVFERFVRLDEARARDDGGAGLGLAIARDVATHHSGTLTVSGARFELRLPHPGALPPNPRSSIAGGAYR